MLVCVGVGVCGVGMIMAKRIHELVYMTETSHAARVGRLVGIERRVVWLM